MDVQTYDAETVKLEIAGTSLGRKPVPPPVPVLRLQVMRCCGPTDARLSEELERLAERVELRLHGGPITAIEVRTHDRSEVNVAVVMRVPDRNPPHEWRGVVVNSPMIPAALGTTAVQIAELVRSAAKYAVDHELDEGITLDGLRVFDPHGPEDRLDRSLEERADMLRKRFEASFDAMKALGNRNDAFDVKELLLASFPGNAPSFLDLGDLVTLGDVSLDDFANIRAVKASVFPREAAYNDEVLRLAEEAGLVRTSAFRGYDFARFPPQQTDLKIPRPRDFQRRRV